MPDQPATPDSPILLEPEVYARIVDFAMSYKALQNKPLVDALDDITVAVRLARMTHQLSPALTAWDAPEFAPSGEDLVTAVMVALDHLLAVRALELGLVEA